MYYAFGQRHGFTVTKKSPNDPPRYVIARDIKANTITVSFREIQDEIASSKRILLDKVNFIAGAEPDLAKKYSARIRYRQELQECSLTKEGDSYSITFTSPQRAAAPGQSVVVYDGNAVLCGGVIQKVA